MADDAHEDRFRQHEAIMAGLARLLEAQHAMNECQETINAELKAFNRQQLEINQDVKTTLARVETLLAWMI